MGKYEGFQSWKGKCCHVCLAAVAPMAETEAADEHNLKLQNIPMVLNASVNWNLTSG